MFHNELNLNSNNGNLTGSLIPGNTNSNSSYKFKLIYFEDRGKADLIKLLFYLGKQEYEDVQIKQTDWNNFKTFMPFEQLPV